MAEGAQGPVPPADPAFRLALGVTGHRETNPAYEAHRDDVAAALREVFDALQAAAGSAHPAGAASAPLRLHTMLADGVDDMAARDAVARGWELVAPLPFGRDLNLAINARPQSLRDAQALLAGGAAEEGETRRRADAIASLYSAARLFELADQDAPVSAAFLAWLSHPDDIARRQVFDALTSERVAIAGRIIIEQSDLLVAVWDGAARIFVGGTGHTVEAALASGTPVIWIDPRDATAWRILERPEDLSHLRGGGDPGSRQDAVARLVAAALAPTPAPGGHAPPGPTTPQTMASEAWRPHSHLLSHAYRRMETTFSGGRVLQNLRETYESPDAIAAGSGAAVLSQLASLPGGDPALADAVATGVLRRFAWANGVSSRLSDNYRGGMTASFGLSAAAVISGIAYLPFLSSGDKLGFAAAEFLLLFVILAVTWVGQKRRWHGRWFETRRVAEYLRHAPILLALGVSRPRGRWLAGAETSWPEWYARHVLRDVGLPRAALNQAYLRGALAGLLQPHLTQQRDYHRAKARQLAKVHHNLDLVSEASFVAAVLSVGLFLGLAVPDRLGLMPHEIFTYAAKWFTLLGVALPTLGAAIAGIRYFGDFDRFAAVSRATAEELDAILSRLARLLEAPDGELDYRRAADLVHATDAVVVGEIQSWQSVFGGKPITVPV